MFFIFFILCIIEKVGHNTTNTLPFERNHAVCRLSNMREKDKGIGVTACRKQQKDIFITTLTISPEGTGSEHSKILLVIQYGSF